MDVEELLVALAGTSEFEEVQPIIQIAIVRHEDKNNSFIIKAPFNSGVV